MPSTTAWISVWRLGASTSSTWTLCMSWPPDMWKPPTIMTSTSPAAIAGAAPRRAARARTVRIVCLRKGFEIWREVPIASACNPGSRPLHPAHGNAWTLVQLPVRPACLGSQAPRDPGFAVTDVLTVSAAPRAIRAAPAYWVPYWVRGPVWDAVFIQNALWLLPLVL